MSQTMDDRVRRANPVERNEQLDSLYGPDVARRLLRDAKRGTVVRMAERTEHTAQPTKHQSAEPTQPTNPERPRRGWLVAVGIAAGVILIAGMATIFGSDRGSDAAGVMTTTIPLVSSEAPVEPQAAIDIVESSYAAFNEGNVDKWLSHYAPDAVVSGIRRADASVRYEALFAANAQRTLTGPCSYIGLNPDGLQEVSCDHTQSNDFHSPGNVMSRVTVSHLVGPEGLIDMTSFNNSDFRELLRYNSAFWWWLEENHPEVYDEVDPDLELRGDDPGTGSRFPQSGDVMGRVLPFVEQFVTESADYPVATDS